MSEEQEKNDLSAWLSTYGLITIERILERYKIQLSQNELLTVIKNPYSFYHQLLRVPLKNVLNGIILQQVRDYQVYAQKLFVDYLMSGENNNTEASGLTKEDLEKERKTLVEMGELLQQVKLAHTTLIAESQKRLMSYAQEWQNKLRQAAKEIKKNLQTYRVVKQEELLLQAINVLNANYKPADKPSLIADKESWSTIEKILGQNITTDLKQIFINQLSQVTAFKEEVEVTLMNYIYSISAINKQLKEWRSEFYTLILRVNELIKLLPEYKYNELKDEENKETLYFDSNIGE